MTTPDRPPDQRGKMHPTVVSLMKCPNCGEDVPPLRACIRCGHTDLGKAASARPPLDPPRAGRCRNTAYDHDCHPAHARKYDGYCLACANAGVPEMMADLAALREEVKRLRETLEFVRTERGG